MKILAVEIYHQIAKKKKNSLGLLPLDSSTRVIILVVAASECTEQEMYHNLEGEYLSFNSVVTQVLT